MKVNEVKINLRKDTNKNNNSIINRVFSFEDACEVLGLNKNLFITISSNEEAINNDLKSIESYTKLIIIARALNEGWEPDWQNSDKRKWYPYFNLASGFAFRGTGYVWTDALTGAGSRLCFKTEELARYAGQQFIELYKEYMVIENKGCVLK